MDGTGEGGRRGERGDGCKRVVLHEWGLPGQKCLMPESN